MFAERWAKGDFGPDKEEEVGTALNSPDKEDAAYNRALLDTVRWLLLFGVGVWVCLTVFYHASTQRRLTLSYTNTQTHTMLGG